MNGQYLNAAAGRLPAPLPGAASLIDWRPWNEALSLIELVADYQVVEAAHDIGRAIWPVHLQIKAGMTRDQEWFPLRDQIEARRRAFVNVAGLRLAPSGPPLRRLTGRPDRDDLIWATRALQPDAEDS